MSRAASLLGILILVSSPTATVAQAAQDAGPPPDRVVGSAHGIDRAQGPAIDGRLDEAVWQDAAVLAGFTQRTPLDGQPASERTEVRVLRDDQAIYVAVWAFDSNAAGIIPGERIRDYELSNSDAIVLIFDTYRDEQNGFVFGTTPAGIEYDGQVANEGQGGGFFLGGGFNRQRRFQAGPAVGSTRTGMGDGPSPRRRTRTAGTRSSRSRSTRCDTEMGTRPGASTSSAAFAG